MKKQEMDAIHEMRLQGKNVSEIGLALGISANTVRSHIRRHPEIYGGMNCEYCGKAITQSAGRKRKRFCSDRCRMAWWNSHREQVQKKAYYRLICVHCGKEFENYGNQNRKFCCRGCYLRSRQGDSTKKAGTVSDVPGGAEHHAA